MRDLSLFNAGSYELGKPKIILYIWYGFVQPIFSSRWCTRKMRVRALRLFGAEIGENVLIRRGVIIQFPWNLRIGSNSWIGENAHFINHAKIQIGANVCVSQYAIVCSGSHDYRSVGLSFKHGEINIEDGVWICLGAKVLAGCRISTNSVISAGEVAYGRIPENSILSRGSIRSFEN